MVKTTNPDSKLPNPLITAQTARPDHLESDPLSIERLIRDFKNAQPLSIWQPPP